jgi:hypothetical protein
VPKKAKTKKIKRKPTAKKSKLRKRRS